MKTPHVVVDGQVFENNYQIGIWRVFFEFMRRSSTDIRYTLLLGSEPRLPLPDGVEVAHASHRWDLKRHQLVHRAARKFKRKSLLKSIENAIWMSTFFSRDPRSDARSVVLTYDMIAERFFYLNHDLLSQVNEKKPAITEAQELLAISAATADDLSRFYSVDRQKVGVLPLGYEHICIADANANALNERAGALFVGHRANYKNFLVVLEAVASPRWPKNLLLRVVGSPFSEAEGNYLKYLGINERVHNVGRVSDAQLASLYASSSCFIFSSLLEGFGIPILESQVNGCLPVLSDIPIFHEVAGDGALYFNPCDSSSLCDALMRALDPRECKRVADASQENFRRYSWECTSEKMKAVFQRIC